MSVYSPVYWLDTVEIILTLEPFFFLMVSGEAVKGET